MGNKVNQRIRTDVDYKKELSIEEKLDKGIERLESEIDYRAENVKEQKRMIRSFDVLYDFLTDEKNEKYAKYWVLGGGRSLASMVLETKEQANINISLSIKLGFEEEEILEKLYAIRKERDTGFGFGFDFIFGLLDNIGLLKELSPDELEVLKIKANKKETQDDIDLLNEYEKNVKQEQERLKGENDE